jgi:hypothetical protein
MKGEERTSKFAEARQKDELLLQNARHIEFNLSDFTL